MPAKLSTEGFEVPSGPLAGEPFTIQPWQFEFVDSALADGIREAALSVAHKNGKSGLIAALLLCHLCGPLNRRDWRAVVVSVNAHLAKELRLAAEDIARASGIDDDIVRSYRSPVPGMLTGLKGSKVLHLSADKSSGHGIGSDLALIDEAGLLAERNRELWVAVASSISGRDGRLMCISIRADGPMFHELIQRAQHPTVHVTQFEAEHSDPLDSEATWRKSNPGLGTIKSLVYMRDMAAKAMAVPADQATFRAFDLNMKLAPNRELLVQVNEWRECVTDELSERVGSCVLGIDLGGSQAMTTAVAIWPKTWRMEAWAAFPFEPTLAKRGEADGVGDRYVRMAARGELRRLGGPGYHVTPVPIFLERLRNRAGGPANRCGGRGPLPQGRSAGGAGAGAMGAPDAMAGRRGAPIRARLL